MDRFDLPWPGTTATLYTNGWRCRIVWRTKQGRGGTIDNNDLCKKRLADGLDSTPQLLGALRAAGHDALAVAIEALAPQAAAPAEAATGKPGRKAGAGRRRSRPKPPTIEQRLEGWLAALPGEAQWQPSKNRRGKTWLLLAERPTGDGEVETLLLKPPAARGKQEWVLKRQREGSAEYFAAPSFRGICAWLVSVADYRAESFMAEFAARLEAVSEEHPELAQAHALWLAQPGS